MLDDLNAIVGFIFNRVTKHIRQRRPIIGNNGSRKTHTNHWLLIIYIRCFPQESCGR